MSSERAELSTQRNPADAPPARPVLRAERFRFLDFLRGVVLLGILPENIPYFALPIESVETALRGEGLSAPDSVALFAVRTFGDYKFLSMFSLMFGIGLALIHQRCEASGRRFRALYGRRILVLFFFGALHGTLLWYGDILALYALGGFVAMWAVRWRPKTLRRTGLVLIAVPFVAMLIFGAGEAIDLRMPTSASQPTASQAAEGAAATSQNKASAPERALMWTKNRLSAENETRTYRDGPWSEILVTRCVEWIVMLVVMGVYMQWRIIGLFLIGISFMKSGWFVHPAKSRQEFARLLKFGLILGIPLQLAATCYPLFGMIETYGELFAEAFQYGGSLGIAAIYIWLLARLFERFGDRRWTDPIVAVGRSALSNYILMSLICNFLFYAYGLRLFGSLGRAQLLAIVPLIWLICLTFSSLWMSRFQFGPLEWIWRKLTYGGAMPIRGSA